MPADFEISPLITPPATQPQPAPAVVGPQPAAPTPVQPPAFTPMTKKSGQLLKWLVLVAAGLVVVTVGAS
jgi:hypothetical protein